MTKWRVVKEEGGVQWLESAGERKREQMILVDGKSFVRCPQGQDPVMKCQEEIPKSTPRGEAGEEIPGTADVIPGIPSCHNGCSDVEEEEEEYIAEKIITKRVSGGVSYYHVKWLGWPECYNTWAPMKHLENARNLVEKFEDEWARKKEAARRATSQAEDSSSDDTTSEDEKEYTVEKLLRKKVSHRGVPFYWVKWRGWPTSANTWEPIQHLKNARDLVEKFDKKEADKKEARYARKRKADIQKSPEK